MTRSRWFTALVTTLVAAALTVPGLTATRMDVASEGSSRGMERADALVAEGSYRKAHEAYQAIDPSSLPDHDRDWLRFRLADTLWRSVASDAMPDPSRVEVARRDLRDLLRTYENEPDRDQLFAEVHESLADSYWKALERSWSEAWKHYETALDWWAGQIDLETARGRYLRLVRKAADPPAMHPWETPGQYAASIPLAILENAVEISLAPDDVAYFNHLLALRLLATGDPQLIERGTIALEKAIALGRGTDLYDDALFTRAQNLEHRGRLVFRNDGWVTVPDPGAALTLYRRLVAEFAKGETRYYDSAVDRIREITAPSIAVTVSNVFLPGSRIAYQLHWRNVDAAEIELWSIDLTRDLELDAHRTNEWLQRISVSRAERIDFRARRLKSEGPHMPASETVKLDRDLPTGAYLLVARAGGKESRDLILVTDVAVVTKSSPTQILTFVTDARSGRPIPGARVRIWEEVYDGNRTRHRSHDATTGADGTASIVRSHERNGNQILATVNREGRQAFSSGWSYPAGSEEKRWRIYAVTDRPAYRPEDTVQWKITARWFEQGQYTTPAGQIIRYEIHDPLGNEISEGRLELNEFGSAWTQMELHASMPLGIYSIRFMANGDSLIGMAQLFRLEEYKLPEFLVSVAPASEEGATRTYRLGDEVEIEIGAEYYFGGPVANATVQVVVHQKPYSPTWRWPHPYPWYFERSDHPGWYGPGQEVLNRVLTTGPDGKTTFTFDTPEQGHDLEYTIEARVTDASRREVSGAASVRVTSQPFHAHMKPRGYLHRPGERVEIDLVTIDANDRPVRAEGELVVTRDTWTEVWLDPKGRRVSGSELDQIRMGSPVFPPPRQRDHHPWMLISRGYEHEEVARLSFATDEEGKATYRFEPPREGFYRARWTHRVVDESTVRPRDVVSAETTVWVADRATRSLGYHSSGLEVIVDDDSFRTGTTSPVMIVTESPGSHVLFTIESGTILEHRVIESRGDVTLVEFEVDDRQVPNVFLSAAMVRDLRLTIDLKHAVVPPVEHFLDVSVELDRDEYQPRERGILRVTTRDAEGRPVRAEVSLGVTDRSVELIQEDFAGDPRELFYAERRQHLVQTTSSFQHEQYVKLTENDDGILVDERLAKLDSVEQEGGLERDVAGGVVGERLAAQSASEAIAVTGNAPSPLPPPAAPPPASKVARAEAAGLIAADTVAQGEVVVRSDFRATALWVPDLVTSENGSASVEVQWPDSLTTWRATARAATRAADFGMSTSEARTNKPLIVRLQAPRFFVVGDEVVVSAIVNNNTDSVLTIDPRIEIEGLELLGAVRDGKQTGAAFGSVSVEGKGEVRLDWLVAARDPGIATVRVQGTGGDFADAMERSYLVWEHGIEKLIASSGRMAAEASSIAIELPRERRPGSTTMSVVVTPSIATTMLDAIPYLIQYPYGCTEQTMSRFLPAVIVMKTLNELGVSRELVASRMFGGVEPESASATHPDGERDLATLDDVTAKGLARLYDFQHQDGGWGWWKEGKSDPFMTAYVVWGLKLASDGGISIRPGVLDRAVTWLDQVLVEAERDLDRQAWMLHAITAARQGGNEARERAFGNLWKNRESLSSYGRALLALSAHQMDKAEQAAVLARNLENGVVFDASPDQSILLPGRERRTSDVLATAHWGSDRSWWRWYDGPVETTAFVLRALVTIDPDHRLIEPAMNWLVRNRRGAQWNNTRDTAISILALNEYLDRSREQHSSASYAVTVNGTVIGTGRITPSTVLTARTRFTVPPEALRDGRNEVRLTRSDGTSPLYFAIEARYFSTEDPVPAEGSEIFVNREYFRLVPHETLLKGFSYQRVPLRDGESLRSGERVEVVLTVETKNDYEYLLFEDLKPAGFEAIDVRSGEPLFAKQLRSDAAARRWAREGPEESRSRVVDPSEGTGRSHRVHQELRDRKVVLFVDELEQGVWEIRYALRAEAPGSFHALPLIGEAMYVPEIRANSEEIRIVVEDR